MPGTVQRRVTHSQLILKTTFKGGDDISITQVRKELLVVKVIELGNRELTQEPISDDAGVCILYAKWHSLYCFISVLQPVYGLYFNLKSMINIFTF